MSRAGLVAGLAQFAELYQLVPIVKPTTAPRVVWHGADFAVGKYDSFNFGMN